VRNVVVTGGSRGIGLGIAQALEEAGYNVIVVARNRSGVAKGRRSFVMWDLEAVETLH